MHQRKHPVARPSAFTLIELLVVIGIILVLIGLLLPVVGRVRTAARNANTTSFISQLARAIDNYYGDFRAYPGPLTNQQVYNSLPASQPPIFYPTPAPAGFDYTTQAQNDFRGKITMAENLVLGLLGGLRFNNTTPPGRLEYDASLVGGGAMSLNNTGPSRRYPAYIETGSLSWKNAPGGKTGHFSDDAGDADDTIIPEFVDQYPDPMPILYMRAKVGAVASPPLSSDSNTIVTYHPTDPNNRVGQYDLHQIIAYTGSFAGNWPNLTFSTAANARAIGVGRKSINRVGWGASPPVHGLSAVSTNDPDPNASLNPRAQLPLKYKYPYDAYPYLRNQSLSLPTETTAGYTTLTNPRNDVPHQKDAYILISAGPDRIYGTEDDITNFGPVGK